MIFVEKSKLLTRLGCIGALALASVVALIGCDNASPAATTLPDSVTITSFIVASESIVFEIANPNAEAVRVTIALASSSSSLPDTASIAIDGGTPAKFAETQIEITSMGTDRERARVEITGLTNDTEYTVTLTTADSSGNSRQATRSATPLVPPNAPANLTATLQNSMVVFTWSAPPAGGAEVRGYRIYRAVETKIVENSISKSVIENGVVQIGAFARLATTPRLLLPATLTYTDTSVNDNISYRYHVRAVSANGTESVDSNIGPSLFHLHANGVTVLCPFAADGSMGDIATVNDMGNTVTTTYTKRAKTGAHAITADNAATSCTSGITDMSSLIHAFPPSPRANFNANIRHWDTSRVTNMREMFRAASSFDRDIGIWNVAAVTNMDGMFWSADSFDQDISSWNVASVTNMDKMFQGAHGFNRNISGWCVSRIRSKPTGFDSGASMFVAGNHPRWGTCPSP